MANTPVPHNPPTDWQSQLESVLLQYVGDASYQLWFNRQTHFVWENQVLTLRVPNRYFQVWLTRKFTQAIKAAIRDVFQVDAPFKFLIDPTVTPPSTASNKGESNLPLFEGDGNNPSSAKEDNEKGEVPETSTLTLAELPPAVTPGPTLRTARRWMDLNSFAVGPSNRLAHSAVRMLLDQPELTPNPLALFGPPGTGKTHLLEGLFLELRKKYGEVGVLYFTAEEFVTRFLTALRSDGMPAFRKQFREAQALLIDQLDFMERKHSSQDELTHTIQSLVKHGRFVAVTCSAHPKLLTQELPRLAEQLLGGGIWNLELPDHRTRQAIIQAKLGKYQMMLPPEVIAWLAERLRGSARELEGTLHQIRQRMLIDNRPATLPWVRSILNNLNHIVDKVITLEELEGVVCKRIGIDPARLKEPTRVRNISYPRMLVMYLARKLLNLSYTEIGQYYGGKTHTTAMAAERKVEQWLAEDAPLFSSLDRCPVRDIIEDVEREISQKQ